MTIAPKPPEIGGSGGKIEKLRSFTRLGLSNLDSLC